MPLGRGPTPTGPSYVVSRVAVPIAAVTASSNAANVPFSFDDNELSEWISDRPDAQPWIEYALARPAATDQPGPAGTLGLVEVYEKPAAALTP